MTFQKSIVKTQVLFLILVLFLVALLTLMIIYQIESQQIKENQEDQVSTYLTSLSHSLALPLWNLDEPVIEKMGEVFLQNDAVSEIRIIREDNAKVYHFASTDKVTPFTSTKTIDVRHKNERVGKLQITVNSNAYYRMSSRYFRYSIISILTTIGVLSLLFGTILKKQLLVPFNRFYTMVEDFVAGNENAFIKPYQYVEFSALEAVLKKMGQTITTQFNDLRKREETSRILFEEAADTIFVCQISGNIVKGNKQACWLTGYSEQELQSLNVTDIGLDSNSIKALSDRFATKNSITTESVIKGKTGTVIPVEVTLNKIHAPQGYHVLAIARDISARREAEERMKSSLREKETLLREIHHRVKNNMQVVAGLLELHSRHIINKQAKDILRESQSRVYALAAVHETLHESDNMSEINLQTYLSNLTTGLVASYSTGQSRIQLKNEIEEVSISINQATPVGLIINELISNAIKYAFPDDREGELTIKARQADGALEMTVSDNGVGFPPKLDWRNSKTLGLGLVSTLVEDQLGGTIDVDNDNGTRFMIKFHIVMYRNRTVNSIPGVCFVSNVPGRSLVFKVNNSTLLHTEHPHPAHSELQPPIHPGRGVLPGTF